MILVGDPAFTTAHQEIFKVAKWPVLSKSFWESQDPKMELLYYVYVICIYIYIYILYIYIYTVYIYIYTVYIYIYYIYTIYIYYIYIYVYDFGYVLPFIIYVS